MPTPPLPRNLEELKARLASRLYQGVIMDFDTPVPVPRIPSGSMNLDLILGGGIPTGRITMLFGPEGGGKTTLAQHIVAEVQAQNDVAMYIDVEGKVDSMYAARCGVDFGKLLFSQPNSATVIFKMIEEVVKSNLVKVIIVDSLTPILTDAEIDAEIGERFYAAQAGFLSQTLKTVNALVSQSDTALIFINQVREKIGQYGGGETIPGGRAPKFYSALIMRVSRDKPLKRGDVIYGQSTKILVHKSNVCPSFRSTTFDIVYGEGIVPTMDALGALDRVEGDLIIVKRGAHYYHQGERIAHGKANAAVWLEEQPDVLQELRRQIRACTAISAAEESTEPDDEEFVGDDG
jgi:recombination protein RecA